MKYQHIVAAVDIYEQQQAALARAVELAKRYSATLEVVHVLPQVVVNIPYASDFQQDMQDEAKKKLDAMLAGLNFPGVKSHLVVGSAARETARVAKAVKADLVVVGSHGKHGVDLMLGSTANGVVHQADCDVLTVRIDGQDVPKCVGPYKKIVLATDLNEDNRPVIDAAFAKAKEYGAELFIINVVPETASMASVYVPDVELELEKHAQDTMADLAKELGIAEDHTRVQIGAPKHDILQYAKAVGADLIIIGSHGRKAFASVVLGSTANSVLHGATTDVWVVRIHRH